MIYEFLTQVYNDSDNDIEELMDIIAQQEGERWEVVQQVLNLEDRVSAVEMLQTRRERRSHTSPHAKFSLQKAWLFCEALKLKQRDTEKVQTLSGVGLQKHAFAVSRDSTCTTEQHAYARTKEDMLWKWYKNKLCDYDVTWGANKQRNKIEMVCSFPLCLSLSV